MAERLIYVTCPVELIPLDMAGIYTSAAVSTGTRFEILAMQGDPHPNFPTTEKVPDGYLAIRVGLKNSPDTLEAFRRRADLLSEIRASL